MITKEATLECRKQAIANFLKVNKNDIKVEVNVYDTTENMYRLGDERFLVLTEAEANEKSREYILDTLFTFGANFIVDHSPPLKNVREAYSIVECLLEKGEESNEMIDSLIDENSLVNDAIARDGRGEYIGHLDNEEVKIECEGITLFIYKTEK